MLVLVMVLGVAAALTPPKYRSVLDEIVMVATDTCTLLPLDALFRFAPVPDLDVLEYTNDGKDRTYKLEKAHKMLSGKLPKNLVIYIPGWWNTPEDESSETLVKSLSSRNPLVLILNTRPTFGFGYVTSASSVYGVAQSLYKFINNLAQINYPPSSVQLIGFSLGAHVAGITGKLVKKGLKKTIGMITALDPARPCFLKYLDYRLHRNDAKLVQVIHSSIGVLGIEDPLGHIDVYLNGATVPQPECKRKAVSSECDHALSWRTFSASVTGEINMIGQKCKNFDELKSQKCNGSKRYIGYGCNSTTRGLFVYKTARTTRTAAQKRFSIFNFFTW